MTINDNTELFKLCNWNENNVNTLSSTNWRASLVPAAAVIPAPIAYIKVVAVKKPVVGPLALGSGLPQGMHWGLWPSSRGPWRALYWVCRELGTFTLKKLECSKQALRLNTLAWNNGIGLWFYFVGF